MSRTQSKLARRIKHDHLRMDHTRPPKDTLMARLKMTKTEQERAAEAAEATAEMTDEEKATEVQAVASKVASDVDKTKPEAKEKAKKDTRPKPVERKTAKRAGTEPARPENDPLQGATIDPDANYAKILNLQVSVGEDDTRSMEKFVEDVKKALTSQANAKIATVLLSKVSVDGKHILHFHYAREVARLRPEEDASETDTPDTSE